MIMSLKDILLIVLVVVSALLGVFILLQNRAEGLGTVFGGGGEVFRTKRGIEKFLYNMTIFLAVVWVSLILYIVSIS
jgi:preprotein translocase subunit SecG